MDDPLAELRRWIDLIECGRMEREEARRTIVVPTAELAVQVEAMAAAAGLGDLWTVRHNPYAPPGYVYVFDVVVMAESALVRLVRAELADGFLTQTEIAAGLGCSQKHLSEMLNGHTAMSEDWATKILAVLGRRLVVASVPLEASDG